MLPDFLMILVVTLFSLLSFLPAANAAGTDFMSPELGTLLTSIVNRLYHCNSGRSVQRLVRYSILLLLLLFLPLFQSQLNNVLHSYDIWTADADIVFFHSGFVCHRNWNYIEWKPSSSNRYQRHHRLRWCLLPRRRDS